MSYGDDPRKPEAKKWRYDPEYRCVWNGTGQSVVSHIDPPVGEAIAALPEMLELLRKVKAECLCEEYHPSVHDGIDALLARIDGPSPVLDPEGT